MKDILKYIALAALSAYSLLNVYDEVTLGNATTGSYVFFNLPLGIVNLLFATYIFRKAQSWLKIVPIVGIIASILILIPPHIYAWFIG